MASEVTNRIVLLIGRNKGHNKSLFEKGLVSKGFDKYNLELGTDYEEFLKFAKNNKEYCFTAINADEVNIDKYDDFILDIRDYSVPVIFDSGLSEDELRLLALKFGGRSIIIRDEYEDVSKRFEEEYDAIMGCIVRQVPKLNPVEELIIFYGNKNDAFDRIDDTDKMRSFIDRVVDKLHFSVSDADLYEFSIFVMGEEYRQDEVLQEDRVIMDKEFADRIETLVCDTIEKVLG